MSVSTRGWLVYFSVVRCNSDSGGIDLHRYRVFSCGVAGRPSVNVLFPFVCLQPGQKTVNQQEVQLWIPVRALVPEEESDLGSFFRRCDLRQKLILVGLYCPTQSRDT